MSNITEEPKVRSMAELIMLTPKCRKIVWFYRLENGDIFKRTLINGEYDKTIIPKAEYNPTNEIIALKKWKVSVHRVEGDNGKWIYLVGDGPEDIPPYEALE